MMLSALVGDSEIEALFTDDADLAAMLRFESALATSVPRSANPRARICTAAPRARTSST